MFSGSLVACLLFDDIKYPGKQDGVLIITPVLFLVVISTFLCVAQVSVLFSKALLVFA